MKTTIIPLSAILLTAITFTSCSPVLYSTVGQNVPMFTQKGEVAASIGYGGASDDINPGASGLSFQAAVAVDSSLAIIGSAYVLSNPKDYTWGGNGSYLELGAGKFAANKKKNIRGEIFLGLGTGSIKNASDADRVEVRFLKPFIQPSGGFSSKVFDIFFTPRLALITYTSQTNQLTDPEMQRQLNNFFNDSKTVFVFEPGVTMRLGYKNVKLQYQYNHSNFNEKTNQTAYFNYSSLSLFFRVPHK